MAEGSCFKHVTINESRSDWPTKRRGKPEGTVKVLFHSSLGTTQNATWGHSQGALTLVTRQKGKHIYGKVTSSSSARAGISKTD